MAKKRVSLLLLILAAMLMSACGASTPAAAPTTAAAPTAAPAPTAASAEATAAPAEATAAPVAGGAKTYVLVPKNLGNPYFDTANKGASSVRSSNRFASTSRGSLSFSADAQLSSGRLVSGAPECFFRCTRPPALRWNSVGLKDSPCTDK